VVPKPVFPGRRIEHYYFSIRFIRGDNIDANVLYPTLFTEV